MTLPTYDEKPPIHPAGLAAALHLIGPGPGWVLKSKLLERIGRRPGGDWFDTAAIADELAVCEGHVRRNMRELDVVHNAIWRDGGDGKRWFWVEVSPDPARWLHVPWRVANAEGTARVEVTRRVQAATGVVEEVDLLEALLRFVSRSKAARCGLVIARWGARYDLWDRAGGRAIAGEQGGAMRAPDRAPSRTPDRASGRAIPPDASRVPPRDANAPAPRASTRPTGEMQTTASPTSLAREQQQPGDVDPLLWREANAVLLARANPAVAHARGYPHKLVSNELKATLRRLIVDYPAAVIDALHEFPDDCGIPQAIEWVEAKLSGRLDAELAAEMERLAAGEAARIRASAAMRDASELEHERRRVDDELDHALGVLADLTSRGYDESRLAHLRGEIADLQQRRSELATASSTGATV